MLHNLDLKSVIVVPDFFPHYMAHAADFATIRTAKTREHLRKVLTQRNCEHCTHSNNTTIVLRVPSTIAGAEICLEIAYFSKARTWSSTKLFRWEDKRQHDRTPTKIASAVKIFHTTKKSLHRNEIDLRPFLLLLSQVL